MSEQAPIPLPEAKASVPVQDLEQVYDQFDSHIPESVAEAQAVITDLRGTSDRLVITEDSAELDGQPVSAELAADVKNIANAGLDTWRLKSAERAAWTKAASANHVSELTDTQRSRLRALKPDAAMPDAMALPLLKADAHKRLSLDEAIAADQGKKVAAVREPKAERVAREQAEAKKSADAEALTKAREEAYKRVSAFYEKPGRATAAAPDIRKATGLSFEDVQHLGYGSYAELENAAIDWKLEQTEKAERAAAKAAAEKREADYQAERQAYRDKRDAAAERVEKLSYAEKLKRGGEIGLRRQPGLAEDIRGAAIDQAEAEGHHVNTMRPSEGYVVPRRSAAAEAETARTVAALKAFHRGEQLSASESDSELAANSFTDVASLLERRRLQLEAEQAAQPADTDDSDIAEAEVIPMGSGENSSRSAGTELTPTGRTEPEIIDAELTMEGGLRARARRAWDSARVRLAAFNASRPRPLDRASVMWTNGTQRAGEYFRDDEKGTRRKIVGGALAATLLAGVVYLEASGHGVGFHHHGSNAQEATNGHGGGGNGNDLPPKGGAPRPEGTPTHLESSVKLGQGDTVWGSVNEYAAQHGRHLTEQQTQLITDKVLKANNLTWSSAHNVPVGYQVHFNQQQFDDWLKLTEKK